MLISKWDFKVLRQQKETRHDPWIKKKIKHVKVGKRTGCKQN